MEGPGWPAVDSLSSWAGSRVAGDPQSVTFVPEQPCVFPRGHTNIGVFCVCRDTGKAGGLAAGHLSSCLRGPCNMSHNGSCPFSKDSLPDIPTPAGSSSHLPGCSFSGFLVLPNLWLLEDYRRVPGASSLCCLHSQEHSSRVPASKQPHDSCRHISSPALPLNPRGTSAPLNVLARGDLMASQS